VPLIVAGPGIPAGVRISGVAPTRQIFETVLDFAGLRAAVLRRGSLRRAWETGHTSDEPAVSELMDNTPPPYPQGLISVTTDEWQLIVRPGQKRSRLYHWPADSLEQHNVANREENQAVMAQLKASLLSIIERSCRPWRETAYLAALSDSGFSPDTEAIRLLPSLPWGPLLPQGAGAAQMLFPPNPETRETNPDEELLRSIPYNAR